MHKMECGQAYCKDLLTRIPRKFISYFSESYFMLNEFLEFLLEKKEDRKMEKIHEQCWAAFDPEAHTTQGRPMPLARGGCV
jgi:hypothetical protein